MEEDNTNSIASWPLHFRCKYHGTCRYWCLDRHLLCFIQPMMYHCIFCHMILIFFSSYWGRNLGLPGSLSERSKSLSFSAMAGISILCFHLGPYYKYSSGLSRSIENVLRPFLCQLPPLPRVGVLSLRMVAGPERSPPRMHRLRQSAMPH